MSGYAVALVIEGKPTQDIVYAIVGVVSAIFVRGAFQYLKETTGHKAGLGVQVRLRRALYAKALDLGPGTLDQKRSGDLLVSLVEGVDQLEVFFGEYLPQLFVALITPIGLFAFMAFLDFQTSLIYLLFALFTLVAPSALHKWNQASSFRRRKAYGDLSAEFLDSVQGLATLKAFGQSGARGEMLADKARAVYRSTMTVLATNTGTTGITWLGIMGGAAAALSWGAIRVQDGSLDLTTLLIVVMLGSEVFRPLRELTMLYHKGMLGTAAAAAVFDLLDTHTQVLDAAPATDLPDNLDASLEFQNVTFTYQTRETPAIKDFTFEVDPGRTVAVVGPSGAGKTTLVWLALRFFDPSQGNVLIGGRDIRSLPLSVVRKHVSVVTQDTYLFHGTVAENLRFGKPDASPEELEWAAQLANVHEFITALPQGYDTIIGERGLRLSGGQRQRIAIARAVLKDAPILILDEALSSVDTENEAVIQEAINRLIKGRTTMVIAHRLSSVMNADRILVLDEGQLAEAGDHQSLLRSGGIYSRLMAAQAALGGEGTGTLASVPARLFDKGIPGTEVVHGPDVLGGPTNDKTSPLALGWPRVLARLLDLVKPWRSELTLTFFLGVLRVFVIIGVGVISALIIREINTGGGLTVLIALIGVLAFLTPVLHWGESFVAHDMAFRLLAEMRIDMYNQLDKLAPAYLVRRRSGDIVSSVTSDVEVIEVFFAHTIAPAFVAVTVPLAVLGTMAAIYWPLALILLPFLTLVAIAPFRARGGLDKVGHEARQQLGEVNAHMVDSVQGIREVLAFDQGGNTLDEVTDNQRIFGFYRLRFLRYVTLQKVFSELAMGLGGLTVLGSGAIFVRQGSLDANLLPMLSITALLSFLPVSEVAQVARELADTLGASRRVFAVHDEPVTVTDGVGINVPYEDKNGSAQFRHATFSYGPDLPKALRDIIFSIEPGQTVALVGRSGAGKTTTANLLLRFWDPDEGAISLEGHTLKEYRLDDLRQRIALVAQDTYLFNSTVRENLKIAKPDATDAELVEAARQAAAHEFISQLPDGYDTRVGERGFQLSGGQRQRVAIARAFLKNAPVLVLDEATSHLDAESESLIRQALNRLMEGRSTLVIAHRLSTVRNADKIIVLDEGKVVEVGSHEQLMSNGGLYSSLVSAQVSG